MIPKKKAIIRFFSFAAPVLLGGICLMLLLSGMQQSSRALAAPESEAAESTITIGVQAALSGGADFIGWRQANAVQLAVNEINAAGGVDIGGTLYTVVLVLGDSQCDPAQAVIAANALVGAGVVAVVGDTCSGASLQAQAIFDAAGVSMVSASSTTPQVTEGGYPTTFRVITRDDTWPRRAAESFYNTYAMRSAAIIEMEGFDGSASSDVFVDTFATTLGGTITSLNVLTSPDDISATLAKIQLEGAQVIYFPWNDAAVAGQIALEAKSLGMADTPIAWDSMLETKSELLPAYDSVAGPAAEMNYSIFYYREIAEMPGFDEFNAAYVAASFPNYGTDAQAWGAFAYDAANIILAAIDRADSTDPTAIRDEIANMPGHQGVVGDYEGFDAKGDIIPQWGDIVRSLHGEWLSLHPDPAALPVYSYWVDDFDQATLGEEWAWVNEDPTHWSLTANPGFLRIALQSTPVVNWLVQPMPAGDFDIQTSLVFTPVANFQLAGLLLYSADNSYLLLGRAFCGSGYPACVEGNGIYFDHLEEGVFISDNFAMRTPYEGNAFLRIIHQDDNYTAYVSEDGVDWWLVGRHVTDPEIKLTSMGLAATTSGQPVEEVFADFDYFWAGPYTPPPLKSLLPMILKLPLGLP